ncbi:MAG: DUF4193 family protein [Actinomycetota bacterium]
MTRKNGHRRGKDLGTIEMIPLPLEEQVETELEALHERADDGELALEELESAMHRDEKVDSETPQPPVGRGRLEFTCTSCFLVMSRARLADPQKMLCRDCAGSSPTRDG